MLQTCYKDHKKYFVSLARRFIDPKAKNYAVHSEVMQLFEKNYSRIIDLVVEDKLWAPAVKAPASSESVQLELNTLCKSMVSGELAIKALAIISERPILMLPHEAGRLSSPLKWTSESIETVDIFESFPAHGSGWDDMCKTYKSASPKPIVLVHNRYHYRPACENQPSITGENC